MTKVSGLNDLLANMKGLTDVVEKATAAAIGQVSIDVAEHAKANHPFQNQTGNLEGSIQPQEVEKQGTEIVGKVVAGMEYAVFVEDGTTRSAPYPFMKPAVNANNENLRKTLAATIVAANKEACK